MSRFDVVVFGSTGYTGKFVFEEAYRQSKKEKFTLAVAGRNEEKVRKSLEESAQYLEDEAALNTPIIIADVKDEKSIIEMAKKSTIVLNCVGPFRFYGEMVVKACVNHGANHLDISGEPQYLESMQLLYHKTAESNGVYVVGACGFDSIPAEIGIKFLLEQFNGALNDVEYYFLTSHEKGMKIHYATWESAVYGLAHRKELTGIRKQLMNEKIPKSKFSAPNRSVMFYSNDVKKWCLPFLGSDKTVVYRSQYFLHFSKGLKAIQFKPYVSFPNLVASLFTILIAGIFGLLSNFRFGRYLLLNFPRFFSCGMVSTEGAPRKVIENSKMKLVIIGRGWNSSSSVDNEKPNRKVICSVSGPEPGYLSCSIFIVQAAITILKEKAKMPGNGGVFPPLAAFYETSYLERIQKNDIHFAKVSDSSVQE